MTSSGRENQSSVRTLLLVAGSGRSGTSLFAGLSNQLRRLEAWLEEQSRRLAQHDAVPRGAV